MPTVQENIEKWGKEYGWSHRGDEWSVAWGGPAMQWYGTVLPRIQRFVPTGSILEIACGYGRWTHYLHPLCERLVALDISEECIEVCRQRFSDVAHIEYHVNDGKSLDMLPDNSVDFAFSFDSLVHADAAVLEAYISQMPRILKGDGGAFFHHSNLGAYSRRTTLEKKVPFLKGVMWRLGVWDRTHHWRDPGVSAALVRKLAEQHGLNCRSQEIVHWGTRRARIDCFTTLAPKASRHDDESHIFVNDHFMHEAKNLKRLSPLYRRG